MRKYRIFKLSWLTLGFVLILMSVIGFFTHSALDRNEISLSLVLAEKGSALINVLERAFFSRPQDIDGVQVQKLAEEMKEAEGITFAAIIDEEGTIIVHSDPMEVGEKMQRNNKDLPPEFFNNPNPQRSVFLANIEPESVSFEGAGNFVVYKEIKPFGMGAHRDLDLERYTLFKETFKGKYPRVFRNRQELPKFYAVIGQNPTFYKQHSAQARFMVLSASLAIFFVAIIFLIILQFTSRNKELQRRQEEAEKIAHEMLEKVQTLEKDLRQKEKLVAIADLTAGVAHEIRNPLSSIKGYATFFKQKFEDDSQEQKAAKIMIEEVDRLNRAIDDLIGVSRSSDIKLQKVDITEICRKICFLLEPDARQKNLILECLCSKNTSLSTFADPDRLRQALLNITLNAMESFQDANKEEKKVSLSLRKEKNSLIIRVQDNGSGIDKEILSRIFDPYFTTKSKGTGLGLVMAKNIIDAHKGSLNIESSPKGTIAEIILPYSSK